LKNRILQALPSKEYRVISPHLRPTELRKGTVLYEAGHKVNLIYFLEKSLVSCLSGTSEGETIEVCVVGGEGVVGITTLFGEASTFRAMVQVSGSALSVPETVLKREFSRCDTLNHLLLRYTHALLVQIAQTAVCNKFHSIEQRLCRWLLMAQDRLESDSFPITQDGIARILGSRRASVTVIAGELERRGIIGHNRGVVRIKDRKRLQIVACECYETIHTAYSKLNI